MSGGAHLLAPGDPLLVSGFEPLLDFQPQSRASRAAFIPHITEESRGVKKRLTGEEREEENLTLLALKLN